MMMIVVTLFILSATGIGMKALCLFGAVSKACHPALDAEAPCLKYRKIFTIWELGKNKFT
jgi:hypothetical protein